MPIIEFHLTKEDRINLDWFSIPNGVTKIGDFTFSGCRDLVGVHIPDSVTKIGDGAFNGCVSLRKVHLPNSVTEIGSCAFCDCNSIREILIPNSVTKIGENAFSDCYHLEKVIIPDSVTEIGDHAFSDCPRLTKIHIPNSVTKIGDNVFCGCKSLMTVHVPKSIKKINGDFPLMKYIIVENDFNKNRLKNTSIARFWCEILTESEALLRKSVPGDGFILKNLFNDKIVSALKKDKNVSLTKIPLRCHTEFDNTPIPSVSVNCDLGIIDIWGKPELYLFPKNKKTPIGRLRKYVEPDGKVLIQAINADLKKASRKAQKQNENVTENIIKHKK